MVTATYSTGAAGIGGLSVTATGVASGAGAMTILVIANPAPTVSLAPHNPGYQSVGRCVASCFDLVYGHSTPAFYTLDQPRSFGIVYSSGTARPTPVVYVDVTVPSGIQHLTTYSIQLQNSATSAFLMLLNGANIAYYTAQPGQTLRLAAAFDATANGLTTGWVPVNVVVTANYSAYGNATTSTSTRVLVDNESGSAFGAGVTMAGLQRIYFKSGSDAVAIAEGGGSIAYYNRTCPTCTFAVPGGSTATLTYLGNTWGPDSTKYERRYLDGTIVGFRTDGRMRNIRDRFGNKTLFTWTDTLLTQVTFPMSKSITLAYTSAGGLTKLSTATDVGGRVTRYTIDASRRLTGIMDPDSVSQTLGYSGSSLLPTTLTDRGGISSTIAYDGSNRVISATGPSVPLFDGTSGQPVGQQQGLATLVWQPAISGSTSGVPKAAIRADTIRASTTDPMGRVTQYVLDRFGQSMRVRTPAGLESYVSRDSMGRVTLSYSARGRQISYTYTGYLLTQMYDQFTATTTRYYYNARNDVDSITGGPAKVVNVYYTSTGYPLRYSVVGGEYAGNEHFYDATGRDTLLRNPYGGSQHFKFDPVWGNVSEVKDAADRVNTVHFDALGRPDTLTDPFGKKRVTVYDRLGRVTSTRDEQGRVVVQQYDARGARTRLVDPKGQVYRWTYNALGAVVGQFDLADTLRADSLFYDIGGQARKFKTRAGEVTLLSYDTAGRLILRSRPGMPDEVHRYANDGAYVVVDNGTAYDSSNSDLAGRLTTSLERNLSVGFTTRRTYDQYSRLTQRVITSGLDSSTATYSYTPRGALASMCSSGMCIAPPDGAVELGETSYKVNPQGTPWTRDIQSWTGPYEFPLWYYGMHGLGLPLFGQYPTTRQMITASPTLWIQMVEDADGNVFGFRYNDSLRADRAFTWDSVGQLTGICDEWWMTPCGDGERHSYDVAGNIIDTVYGTPTRIAGPGNRYLPDANGRMHYDLNGRLVARAAGDSTSYHWNADGQLVEVKWNGISQARFGYDALGRRAWKAVGADTLRFFHDGATLAFDVGENGRVLQEYASFPTSHFIYGIKNASWSGIILDEPGSRSTLQVVDYATGSTVFKSYSYSLYGGTAPDGGPVVRQRFAGAEYDQETGLYLMGARYYDPGLGRFLSEDPSGVAGGINLYEYANNNPIRFRDPSGLEADARCDPDDGGGAGHDPYMCSQQGGGYPMYYCPTTPGQCWSYDPGISFAQEYYAAMDYMDFLAHGTDAAWAVATASTGSETAQEKPSRWDQVNECRQRGQDFIQNDFAATSWLWAPDRFVDKVTMGVGDGVVDLVAGGSWFAQGIAGELMESTGKTMFNAIGNVGGLYIAAKVGLNLSAVLSCSFNTSAY